MDPLLVTLGLVVIVLTVLYFYGTATYDFWKSLDVKYVEPKYPFLGTEYERDFGLVVSCYKQKELYERFKDEKYFGQFSFRRPILVLRDPSIIESVLIKDFSSLTNRPFASDPKEKMSAHLLNFKDGAWKALRNKLTPVFSSGKLKGMHEQLLECSEDMTNYLMKFTDGTPFEAKAVMSRYSINVIASCAFGLSADGLNENSSLAKVGMAVFSNPQSRFWTVLRSYYPRLFNLLTKRQRQKSKESRNVFVSTIKNTLEYREKNNVFRPDFLHLLHELNKKDMKELEENPNLQRAMVFDENVFFANSFVFFVAGFETTATTLSFALYEMAVNQDIQEKLYSEIMNKLIDYDDKLTYEALSNLNYLKQVISETLRKYPPAVSVSREASVDYKIPGTDKILPAGTILTVPTYSLHHDPKYYPNPDKFDPERFSEENKHKLAKNTFLPFGDGPRICIGARFARFEAEVALATIVMKYKIELNKKTISPLKFKKISLLLSPEGGIWLNVTPRN